MRWKIVCIVVINLISSFGLDPLDDPYKILGVKKSSTAQELRRAYKKLVKKWHPDKNDDPTASSKFVEITQAYELLNDPERKKQYDNHGTINPDSSHKFKQEYHFDEFDPFDNIFNFPEGFRFISRNPAVSLFHKLSVTARAFENNLLPKSFISPHLILFYSDWCFGCVKIEPMWRKIIQELEPIGVEIATVHSGEEQLLAKKCGVSLVPALVLLIGGKTYLFRESLYSLQKVVDFIRSKFPYKMIINVDDENVNDFLEGWHDNKIRALIFEKNEIVRLRYLIIAFYFVERVSFGFVRLGLKNTAEIKKNFKVSSELETLLLFNENIIRPVARISMSAIPVATMKDIISSNKYLILPRLSSQKVMDSVCPIEWTRRRKRLCVVLISKNIKEHDDSREAMRRFAQESAYDSERVRFSYMYQERQHEFIHSLLLGSSRETILNVVILWRRDVNHVNYEWMQGSWTFAKTSPEWNKTKEKLHYTISKLLRADESFSYEAIVKELIDEQAQGLMGKIINKLLIAADVVKDHVKKDHVLAAASAVGTVIFILVFGYFMAHLVRNEEEKIKLINQQNNHHDMKNSQSSENVDFTSQLRLYELRGESYNGLVRLLKPGCRTIILLLDSFSRNMLLKEFHIAVWPYRKNKTLMFGYMSISRGLDWYKKLLSLSLSEPRDLDINPRNCIGTVLSLNGHRKYFCMYHAKHPERFKDRGSKRMLKMTGTLRSKEKNMDKIGSFVGFDDSSESDSQDDFDVEQGTRILSDVENEDILLEKNLLKGLPNWLDRLFEGTTHRYYINYWPDFTIK